MTNAHCTDYFIGVVVKAQVDENKRKSQRDTSLSFIVNFL